MNYLLEAAQTLGIYFTPSHIQAMGYGDGKTACAYIAGNPPFVAPCACCKGARTLYNTDGSQVWCSRCNGSGEEPQT